MVEEISVCSSARVVTGKRACREFPVQDYDARIQRAKGSLNLCTWIVIPELEPHQVKPGVGALSADVRVYLGTAPGSGLVASPKSRMGGIGGNSPECCSLLFSADYEKQGSSVEHRQRESYSLGSPARGEEYLARGPYIASYKIASARDLHRGSAQDVPRTFQRDDSELMRMPRGGQDRTLRYE